MVLACPHSNRLEGMTIPQCLPEEVVDALKEEGCAELVEARKRGFSCGTQAIGPDPISVQF